MTMSRGGCHRDHGVSEGVGPHVARLDAVGGDVSVCGHIIATLHGGSVQGGGVAHSSASLKNGTVSSVSLQGYITLLWPRQLLDSSWWQG